LKNLEKISMGSNNFKEVPKSVSNLNKLKDLDISNNSINKLNKDLLKLQKLETLNISRTKLRELPSFILEYPNLKTLDVSSTIRNIKKLPKEFCERWDINPYKKGDLNIIVTGINIKQKNEHFNKYCSEYY